MRSTILMTSLSCLAALYGCDSADPLGPGQSGESSPPETAPEPEPTDGGGTIAGRVTPPTQGVTSTSGQSPSDSSDSAKSGDSSFATVTAFRVEADGSLTAIHTAETAVDVSGHYLLDVDVEAGADVVVHAEGEVSGDAVFRIAFDENGVATAPPVTVSSDVKADIFVSARATGQLEGSFGPGYIDLFVSQDLMLELAAALDYSAEIEATASAVVAGCVAMHETMEEQGASQPELEDVADSVDESERILSIELDAAVTKAEIDAAIEAHVEAAVDAYVEAGVEAQTVLTGVIAAREAIDVYCAELGAEAEALLRVTVETTLALAACAAIDAEVFLSASAHADAQTACAELLASLEAAAELGASADVAIADAWAQWEASIEAAVHASAGLSATVIATVEAEIELLVELLVDTQASATASIEANASASVDAVVSYWSSATSSDKELLLTASGMTSIEAEAALDLLAGASACGQ